MKLPTSSLMSFGIFCVLPYLIVKDGLFLSVLREVLTGFMISILKDSQAVILMIQNGVHIDLQVMITPLSRKKKLMPPSRKRMKTLLLRNTWRSLRSSRALSIRISIGILMLLIRLRFLTTGLGKFIGELISDTELILRFVSGLQLAPMTNGM